MMILVFIVNIERILTWCKEHDDFSRDQCVFNLESRTICGDEFNAFRLLIHKGTQFRATHKIPLFHNNNTPIQSNGKIQMWFLIEVVSPTLPARRIYVIGSAGE